MGDRRMSGWVRGYDRTWCDLDRVSETHLNMMGSVSADSKCAACTAPRATISTRVAFEAERFCNTTAHTRFVLVSHPFDSELNTEITPSSSIRDRTDFISARLHSAAAQMCLTLEAVVVEARLMMARTTFSIKGYELSTHVKLYSPLARQSTR